MVAWLLIQVADNQVQASSGLQATSVQPINYIILGIVLLVAGFQIADRFLTDLTSSNPNLDAGAIRSNLSLPDTRLELVTPATNAPAEFALSPDGRQIMFVANDDSGTSQLWLRALSVSNSGMIAYRTGDGGGRQLTWVDRTGTVLGTLGEPDGTLRAPSLSPDGHRVAVSRLVQGNFDIWLLDGAGEDTLLLSSDQNKFPNSWSADGRFLLYHSVSPDTARDLWALPMTGDAEPFIVLQTPFDERWVRFSPDGRWLAGLPIERVGPGRDLHYHPDKSTYQGQVQWPL